MVNIAGYHWKIALCVVGRVALRCLKTRAVAVKHARVIFEPGWAAHS